MSGFTHFNEDGNAVMVDVGEKAETKENSTAVRGDPHVGRMLSESKGRQHEKRRCSWRSKNCRDHGCKKDSRTDSAVPSVKPYQVEIDLNIWKKSMGSGQSATRHVLAGPVWKWKH